MLIGYRFGRESVDSASGPASLALAWRFPGPEDDESCVCATASEIIDDPPARALVRAVVGASGIGGMIESVAHDPLFEFDLEQVDVARWLDIGQPGTGRSANNGEPSQEG